jgi:hypothetical protein
MSRSRVPPEDGVTPGNCVWLPGSRTSSRVTEFGLNATSAGRFPEIRTIFAATDAEWFSTVIEWADAREVHA